MSKGKEEFFAPGRGGMALEALQEKVTKLERENSRLKGQLVSQRRATEKLVDKMYELRQKDRKDGRK